jgi:hypothetical protein
MVSMRSPAADFGMIPNVSVRFNEQAFDKSNFSQLTMLTARKRCEDLLQVSLDLVDQAAALTATQKSKLELAGQIDIHRFFASYQQIRQNIPTGEIANKEWQTRLEELRDEVLPLKKRYHQGLHGEASLFAKTLSTTLRAEQSRNVDQLLEKRARNMYLNDIRVTLAAVDRIVPLTRKQRSHISKLLISRNPPPASYRTATTPIRQVLLRMVEVEEEIRGVFSEQEWMVIGKLIRAGEEPE